MLDLIFCLTMTQRLYHHFLYCLLPFSANTTLTNHRSIFFNLARLPLQLFTKATVKINGVLSLNMWFSSSWDRGHAKLSLGSQNRQ